MNPDDKTVDAQLNERFQQLPKVVQNAIMSADVEKHLRGLAETHKLHLDQWQVLENEVMMTLLGFQNPEDLQGNIKTEVGVDDATAAALAADVSANVFQPIREELERQLEQGELDLEAALSTEVTPGDTSPDDPPDTQTTPRAP